MNISPLNVISWLHHQNSVTVKVPYTVPTIKLCDNGNDDHYLMVNDNEAASMAGFKPDERFMYAKCLSSPKHSISACSTELQQLVKLALKGFNVSLTSLSVGAVDSYKLRKDTVYQLINLLDVELCKQNIERRKRKQAAIQLEYAYIGIVDNFCYDLRKGQRIENAELLDKGLDPWMRRVHQVDKIWDKVRVGSSIPFILYLRLTDEAKFLGNVTIADLLHPEFQKPIVAKPASSIYYSFTQLRRTVVQAVNNSDFSKPFSLDLNSCVLTRLLAEYLVGLGRTVVVMHVNESLYHNMEETLHALRFARFLQTIQCLVVPNKPDIRVDYYRCCLFEILLKYKNDKLEYVQCKKELKERKAELKRLTEQMDEQKKAIELLTLECATLRQQRNVPSAIPSSPEEKEELEEELLQKEQQQSPHDDDTNAIEAPIDLLYCRYHASTAGYKAIKHENELRKLRIELLKIESTHHGTKQIMMDDVSEDDDKNVPIPLDDYSSSGLQLSTQETQEICSEMNRVLTDQIQESERAQQQYHDNTQRLEIELEKSRREARYYKEISMEKRDMQQKLHEQDQRSQLLTNELSLLKEQLVLCNREISKQKANVTHWKEVSEWSHRSSFPSHKSQHTSLRLPEIQWTPPQPLRAEGLRAYIDQVHNEHLLPPDEDDEMELPHQLKTNDKGELIYDLNDSEDIVMQSSSYANTSSVVVQRPESSPRTPPPTIDPRNAKRTKLRDNILRSTTHVDRGPRVDVYVDTRESIETPVRRKKEDDDDGDDARTPLQVISENPQGPQKRRRVRSSKS